MMSLESIIPFPSRRLTNKIRENDLFYNLRRELDKFFEPDLSFKRENFSLMPSIEVKENNNELIVTTELPGVDEKDIDVSLSNNTLTIKGEKKSEKEETEDNYYISERSYGNFSRSFTLPYDVEPEAVKAKFSKGVLTISFSKSQAMQQKTKKIEIKT